MILLWCVNVVFFLLVVTLNPADQCLLLFPQGEWERLADKVSALPLTDPRSAAFRRAFFSAAEDLSLIHI